MEQAASNGPRPSEPWTVERVLAWATEDFRRRQYENARLDAELLLGHVLGVDRIQLIVDRQRPLAADELGRYRELIKRRRTGEPIAHIRGHREFYGLSFLVDRRVLVPRPDTETLVEVGLERTEHLSLFGRALDLCTGCGSVAIAFAHHRPAWEVTAGDVSADAVSVARENALRTGVVPNVRVRTGDLFEVAQKHERYDLITANPPYVPTGDWEQLEPGIREFEPRLALDGGSDGLDCLRRIAETAPPHLEPGGILAVEVGYDQAERVAALFGAAGFEAIDRRRDYGGHERVVSGRFASM